MELVQRKALIRTREIYPSYSGWQRFITRNIYKNDDGIRLIKYNHKLYTVYIAKTYDANYGYFLGGVYDEKLD